MLLLAVGGRTLRFLPSPTEPLDGSNGHTATQTVMKVRLWYRCFHQLE